jgi:hypothetical protein
MMGRTHTARITILSVVALVLLQAGALGAAKANNLTLQSEIDFGLFTGKVFMCGFGTETPVNHVKASEGHKYLLISVRILKLKEKAEVSSSSFVLEGAKATFAKPGAWGKVEIMGSKRDFEASAGAALIVREANDVVNLFFEVPDSAREQDFNLKYR